MQFYGKWTNDLRFQGLEWTSDLRNEAVFLDR